MKNNQGKPGCPIVIIHRGYSWYLPYTLRHARLYNPTSPLFLVTDQKRSFLKLFARNLPLQDHMQEADAFSKIYTHLSHNQPAFELFCFQRWFVLHSVMAALELDHCFYLDTDVLVYSNLSAVRPAFAAADMTLNFKQGPYSTFINNCSALRGFCEYITRLFTHHTVEMAADFETWKRAGVPGGISDMHALRKYAESSPLRTVDTAEVKDGACFDNVFHESDGFEMKDGIKQIEWRNGIPYGRRTRDREKIRFHTLHMQGNSKGYILSYQSKLGWMTRMIGLYNRFNL
ncbi:MAG: hypothetical protein ABIY47_17280 [Opitutaceae bacterium]